MNYVRYNSLIYIIAGTVSEVQLDNYTSLTNGCEVYENEEYLESTAHSVKEEPVSEEDAPSDIPLECMLCTKKLHTFSGLKAHVITQHNYKSVKRKLDSSTSPGKNKTIAKKRFTCSTCKRSFVTSTDLIVHEVCHNKFSCFVCNAKFDSFKEVTAHRKKCNFKKTPVKPKTLTDILRARIAKQKENVTIRQKSSDLQVRIHCLKCSKLFENMDEYKIHKEEHHAGEENAYSEEKDILNNEKDKENVIDNKIEIEVPNIINFRRISIENKERIDEIVKKEKQDADYDRIETELESIFDIAVEKRPTPVKGNNEKQTLKTEKEIKEERTIEEILSQESETDSQIDYCTPNLKELCNGDDVNDEESLPCLPTMDVMATDLPNSDSDSQVKAVTPVKDIQQTCEPMEIETNICSSCEQNDTSEQTSEGSSENIHINNETPEQGVVVVNIEKNEVSNILFYENEDLKNKIELSKVESVNNDN